MRSIFILPSALALFLIAGFFAPPARAQSAAEDLYGVPDTASPTPSPDSAPVEADSANIADTADTSTVPATADTAASPLPPPPRARITRETTINPLDAQRGSYRNPKKALFMSLVVPGLGQAYVGQSAFNYARAAVYLGTEVTLISLWYHYTVVKYDREVRRYERFADTHWSQGLYEDDAFAASAATSFADLNPSRSSYCDAVQERSTTAGPGLYAGCVNLLIPDSASSSPNYQNFRNEYDDKFLFPPNASNPDSAGARRAAFADPVLFYALIGRYQEFVAGWEDAQNVVYTDSVITGTSAHRDAYNAMRQKAQDYSRMQAWFIGGIVLNHIASAVDAALTARHNNKLLYEGEARWYDRVKMDGGLAFEQGRPRTHMTARLSF